MDIVTVNTFLILQQRVSLRDIDKEYIEYERTVYGTLTLLGDLGGVHELVTALLAYFLCPWATLNFNLKVFERLY